VRLRMEKARAELVFQVGMVVDSVDEVLENLRSCFDLEEDSVVVKSTKEQA